MVIYQSSVSGGTDRLLIHLIKSWPDENTCWEIYLHHENSGIELFLEELRTKKVDIKKYYIGNNQTKDNSKKYIIFLNKVFNKIFRIPLLCLNFIKIILFFKKRIKISSPEILYLHNGGYPGSIDLHAASISTIGYKSLRVIMGIHNVPALKGKSFKSLSFNYLNNLFIDQYILGSKRSKSVYKNKTNLDKKKLIAINEGTNSNPVDLKSFNQNSTINIGIIGAYERRKGHKILFKAAKVLINEFQENNFKILCFGQSKYGYYNEIELKAEALGLKPYIEFNEYEKNMDKLYGLMDIIVSPSTSFETMPLVLIDAMAYYRPVIGSKLQGIMDVIDHGVNGYLFDIGDYKTLANYINILIKDDKKRKTFGFNGRKKYEKNFTAERMAKEYHNVFI